MKIKKVTTKLQKNKNAIIGIIISVIFAVAIIVGIIVLVSLLGGPFERIDEFDYTYESISNENLTLEIYNSVGQINIEYDESLTTLFEGTIVLYGRENANISQAKNFTSIIENNRVVIKFDSGKTSGGLFDKTAFYHELYLSINPIAIVNFDIETEVGGIEFRSDSTTVTIIEALSLSTTTGGISVDFGENTVLDTETINLTGTTGLIEFISEDVNFTSNITFNIDVTTGGVDLFVAQTSFPSANYTAIYNVKSTTGGIDLNYQITDSNIGIKMVASVTTGNIDLPGDGNSYETSGYESKDVRYYFDLETTTGGIIAETYNPIIFV